MKALSIRQPWAWMILHAGKDIENREWPTRFRGRVLVHASKGMTANEWADAWGFAESIAGHEVASPHAGEIERGGIVGSVEIVDCVTYHDSPWFCGPYGFVLKDPRKIEFIPYKGQLGFFEVPDSAFKRS